METRAKIIDRKRLPDFMARLRAKRKKVVFTNGCFDILHLGHIDYLEKARQLGDVLAIGLNTDQSVNKLKGPGRPINNEHARARLLAAMAFVDVVILFDDPTPESLISQVRPDVLVKGDDYNMENIVGAKFVKDIGGKVVTLQLVEGYSTTELIKKIKTC